MIGLIMNKLLLLCWRVWKGDMRHVRVDWHVKLVSKYSVFFSETSGANESYPAFGESPMPAQVPAGHRMNAGVPPLTAPANIGPQGICSPGCVPLSSQLYPKWSLLI